MRISCFGSDFCVGKTCASRQFGLLGQEQSRALAEGAEEKERKPLGTRSQEVIMFGPCA